jgi:hypothetical protein
MMADYNISPNIVLHCKPDVDQFCSKVSAREVIHCLMGVAKEQVKVGTGQNVVMQSRISAPCFREINNLLLEADVAGDVAVDSLLYDACRNVIDGKCQGTKTTAQ